MLDEDNFSPNKLSIIIGNILTQESELLGISVAAKKLATLDAHKTIVNIAKIIMNKKYVAEKDEKTHTGINTKDVGVG